MVKSKKSAKSLHPNVQLPMDISSNISKLSLTYRYRVIASTVVLAVIMLISMG